MATMQTTDVTCPVPLDRLGQLYRADPVSAADMLTDLSDGQRMDLAFFCYGRAHLRPLGMTIAATCDAVRLAQRAGPLGQVLAAQCRQPLATASGAKITLAGTRH